MRQIYIVFNTYTVHRLTEQMRTIRMARVYTETNEWKGHTNITQTSTKFMAWQNHGPAVTCPITIRTNKDIQFSIIYFHWQLIFDSHKGVSEKFRESASFKMVDMCALYKYIIKIW